VADRPGVTAVRPGWRPIALAVALAIGVMACSSSGASFSTSGPCVTDGRAPGAYPELEARVPKTISGRPATSLDSGRNCSAEALGSFTSHDVHELHFAGATWDEGNSNGVSIAVLALPGTALPVAWAEEFYALGAANAKNTGNVETTRPTYPGAGAVYRIDTLNDLSFQTVVVWPDGDLARVVIVATQVGPTASKTVHDARVAEAVGAAALVESESSKPAGSPTAGPSSSPDLVLPSAS
jgi:hypothetical protein